MTAVKKKFTTEVDYNKSTKACPACASECEKINKRVNNRKLSEIKTKEVPHILKVFNFWFSKSVYAEDFPFSIDTNTFHVYKADYKLWE